ncbi:GTPase [Gordonia alkanivorans]|uniref:GTPase n=1 Tax=Gordonia alkanivorans TaxID=84096 RepID=UPI0004BCEFD8|nr:GTPase [Gordonia alkanivorans]
MEQHLTVRGRVEQLLDEVAPLAPDPALIGSLRAQLANPLTVALVGRVSAGKSTLLNALVGDRVAPTDRAECTKVAALYTEGNPQRVEVVGLDGTVTEIPGTMRGDLGRTPDDIDHAVVYTPSRLLRERFRVIDTPGLSGFTDTAEIATRRVFSGEGRLPRPDVVLFLLDDAAGPKADEVQFLADAGASAQNTILVISHADLIAADNPMLKAQEIARRVWRRFPAIAGAVVAVSGLMAEAGVCGVTERETAQISRRGLLESWELLTILDGAAPPPPGLDVDLLGRLEELVGTYAMDAGADIARQGARAYCEWLHRVSGIDELRLAIGRRFLAVGDILKARTVLAELREAAYRSPRRDVFLEAIEEAETAPELHRLREVAALEALARWQPDSDLVGELNLVVASRDVRLLLSLPPDAAPPQIADAAKERATDCRMRRAFAATSAEKEALLVLEQTYQLVRRGRWTT